jgi:hypothetical protein
MGWRHPDLAPVLRHSVELRAAELTDVQPAEPVGVEDGGPEQDGEDAHRLHHGGDVPLLRPPDRAVDDEVHRNPEVEERAECHVDDDMEHVEQQGETEQPAAPEDCEGRKQLRA